MLDNSFYKSIVEYTSIGYSYNKIIYNDNGEPEDYEFTQVNKAYETMLGIEAKDLIGKKFSQIYQSIKKNQKNWHVFHKNILAKYRKKQFEHYFFFTDKYYKVKLHHPKKDYILIALSDVSREIEETEKLKMLFDNIPIQLWYLNDLTTYVSANKVHADFIGIESSQLISRDIRDIFSEEEANICIEGNREVFKQKKPVVVKEWLKNSHGENRLLRISKTPKLNPKDEIDYVICLAEDISQEYINKEQEEKKERILYSSMEFTQELLTNDNIDNALYNGIEMLGNATRVDRVYYWENHFDQASKKWLTSQKLEWCLGDVTQQIDNPELQDIAFEDVSDFIGVLAQNKSFSCHVKDMDPRSSTRESLESQDILSILVIPVFLGDEFRGFIGFDSVACEKEWSQVEISLLNSFVLLYVRALEKTILEKHILQVKENFNNFFNMIEDLFFVVDFQGHIIDFNDRVLERLNYSREELLGKHVSLIHPKDRSEELKNNLEKVRMKRTDYSNIPAITKDALIFPIETRVTEGLWNEEKVFFAISKDISELTISEEKFSKAFNDGGASMFIAKFNDGEFLEVNDTFLDFIGYKKEEVIGRSALDLGLMSDCKYRDFIKKKISTDRKISDLEIEFLSKDKIVRTGLASIVPLNINNEKCLLASIIDISDRVEYEEKILEISNRDSLTGVYNRNFVYEMVEGIIEEYRRNDKLFSVAIIDIDDFKRINDNFGHQIGDEVLIGFAKIIDEDLRSYDILGRYGGEEFILIINHSSIEESYLVIERILNAVRKNTFVFNAHKIKITFSAGISSCQELEKQDVSIDNLVEIADKRMYLAKRNGKNKIIYNDLLRK